MPCAEIPVTLKSTRLWHPKFLNGKEFDTGPCGNCDLFGAAPRCHIQSTSRGSALEVAEGAGCRRPAKYVSNISFGALPRDDSKIPV